MYIEMRFLCFNLLCSFLSSFFFLFLLDQDGFLDLSDLEQAGDNLGLKFTRHDFAEMIEEADRNGDGKVNFMEFTNVMLRTNLFVSDT